MMEAVNFDSPTVEITSGGVNFSYLKNNESIMPNIPAPDDSQTTSVTPKRRGRPPKVKDDGGLVKAEVVSSTLDDYRETNSLIRQTLSEVDTLTVELKEEMDTIRSSRTLKNKYMYLSNISANIGSLLATKIQGIREMNSVIKTAADLDYKKQKDMLANSENTDQQIFSMYNAFVNSPVGTAGGNMAALGPNTLQMSVPNDNVVRVNQNGAIPQDIGLQNFQANMTPEQRMMIMEDQVKEVVVYDKATGQKYFDVVDQNGNSVPNVPRKDPMFLKDYVINSGFTLARNNNLNNTLPVIVRNANSKNALSEY